MNLQESIRRILREYVLNETTFFRRRVNLSDVRNSLNTNSWQVFQDTKNYRQFKYELTLRAVESILWNDYAINWEELPEQEEIEFVTKVSNMIEKDIKSIYNSHKQTKVLKEQSEDFNTTIEEYDYGFDVFIMDGDKKIGEISFAKESIPNVYTIVDAVIDDEYKGNRIYPKTIINLFKERPNLIINSVFRSPEAEKSWRYILSNLPSNIGKSVKYYKEEDTTLIQLKLKNGPNV